MIEPAQVASLEASLNCFDLQARRAALDTLLRMAESGDILQEPMQDVCNMHCHTFFSFNAYGHSPTSLAWLGKRQGYSLMGIVDFDVLDGVDEFLDASAQSGVKGTAGIETRVFIPEYASREINSPGEPGIAYHMGIGFTTSTAPAEVAPILAGMRQRAAHRNRMVVGRVNAFLSPVEIDYEQDVLPLTPAGTATERHIVVAYIRAAVQLTPDPATFWAEKLQLTQDAASALLTASAKHQNAIRAKLMKRGGAGYIEPAPETFPTVDEFHRFILACGALPCAAWLDGSSTGEQEMEELLEILIAKGVVAINIVPDRNWNISDPQTRAVRVKNLYDVIRLARHMHLPIHVGTEMNSFGQKLVDDFDAPDLAPLRQDFLDGANFTYGHTVLQRQLGLGYGSEWAKSYLPSRPERNRFYTQVGSLIPPGLAGLERLRNLDPGESIRREYIRQLSPVEILSRLDI